MIQIHLTYNITFLKKDLYLYEMLNLLKYISLQLTRRADYEAHINRSISYFDYFIVMDDIICMVCLSPNEACGHHIYGEDATSSYYITQNLSHYSQGKLGVYIYIHILVHLGVHVPLNR